MATTYEMATYELAEIGTEFDIIIRGRPVRARVVQTPFYKRARAA